MLDYNELIGTSCVCTSPRVCVQFLNMLLESTNNTQGCVNVMDKSNASVCVHVCLLACVKGLGACV